MINPLNNQSVKLAYDTSIDDTTFRTVGKLKKTSDDSGVIGKQFLVLSAGTGNEELIYVDLLAEPTLFLDNSGTGKENIYEYTGIKFGIESDDKTVPPTLCKTDGFKYEHKTGDLAEVVITSHFFAQLDDKFDANSANRFLQAFCFDKTTDVTVGDGRVYYQVPAKFNGDSLNIANATVLTAGATNDTTIQIAKKKTGLTLGDSTTQFDITNTSGDIYRYTYDGTGTDPNIEDSITSVQIDDEIVIAAQNFDSNNNGTFAVTAVADNYFEVTNASGVVESDKTIGTGSIKRNGWFNMLSTPITISDTDTTGSGVIGTGGIITGDILRIDIDSVSDTAPKGLIVNLEFNG